MKYLVTGGAGFIGSALCERLLARPAQQVTVVDKFTYASTPASLAPLQADVRLRIVRADICDVQAMVALVLAEAPDVIFHLAAETHVDRSIDSAGVFVETNVIGTFSMLQAARAHHDRLPASDASGFRFVHISTDEVFGSLGAAGQFDETTPYDPTSPYSATKAGADHLVRAWHRTYGLPVIVSNCSNNYGPRQFPEKLIPLTILNAIEGKPLPVYGTGANVRDWIYVGDHAEALLSMAQQGKPGETYAVGGNCQRTNLDVVKAICKLIDVRLPAGAPHERLIRFVDDRAGHDFRYSIDSRSASERLGWTPSLGFEEGLGLTVDWYLSNRDWWQPLRDTVYAGGRLGVAHAVRK